MLEKLLANKKVVIVVLVLLLVLIVGVIILATRNSEKPGSVEVDTVNEQSETDADKSVDGEEEEDTGLQMLKPDEVATDDTSNASGSWDGNNDNSQKNDQGTNEEKPVEDIIKDDVTWGDVY